jgi:hypothetical protein
MRKRKLVFVVAGALLLVVAGFSTESTAGVNVNIGINIPAYRVSAPPPMVVIPGTYVYFVPDIDVDILFYHGYWYRPHRGRWYRSTGYNGPWVYLAPARLPRVLVELPPDYRHIPPGHRRIPYGEFNRNWRTWERDKYWERDERWREGRHRERRGERRGERHEDHRERGRHD